MMGPHFMVGIARQAHFTCLFRWPLLSDLMAAEIWFELEPETIDTTP